MATASKTALKRPKPDSVGRAGCSGLKSFKTLSDFKKAQALKTATASGTNVKRPVPDPPMSGPSLKAYKIYMEFKKAQALQTARENRLKDLPRDLQIMGDILQKCYINYEDLVLDHLLHYTNNYVTTIFKDALQYASHAEKTDIDIEDVNLAIQIQQEKNCASPPESEILHYFTINRPYYDNSSYSNNDTRKPHAGITLDTDLPPPPKHYLSTCNIHHKSAAMAIAEKEAAEREAARKKAAVKKAAKKEAAEKKAAKKKAAKKKAAKKKAVKKKAAKKLVHSLKQIQLGDLVLLDQKQSRDEWPLDQSKPAFYSAKRVGVVVRIKKNKFHILNMNGDVVKVKQRSVSKLKHKRPFALDFEDNRICVGDVVKIVLGPHAGCQGEIKHIYRGDAFLHSRMMPKNRGFFVCNLRCLVSVLLDSGGRRGAFRRPRTPDPVPVPMEEG